MNERIRELRANAVIPVQKSGYTSWVFSEEKFAELIVEECISTIEIAENGYQDYRNQIEDSMRNHCINLIRNKFQV